MSLFLEQLFNHLDVTWGQNYIIMITYNKSGEMWGKEREYSCLLPFRATHGTKLCCQYPMNLTKPPQRARKQCCYSKLSYIPRLASGNSQHRPKYPKVYKYRKLMLLKHIPRLNIDLLKNYWRNTAIQDYTIVGINLCFFPLDKVLLPFTPASPSTPADPMLILTHVYAVIIQT